jgi:hypothetical protein
MADNELQLSRVYVAGLAGALIGGVLSALIVVLPALWSFSSLDHDDWLSVRNTLIGGSIFASVFFLIGLLTLGVPAWVALHVLGRRHWYDALMLGALLAFAATFAISYAPYIFHGPGSDYSAWDGGKPTVVHYHLTAQGWRFLIEGAVGEAIAGAFAGLAVWRIAYRKQ